MRRPHLTEKAREDLQEIRRYTLKAYGAAQADRYLAGLREKLDLLAAIPGMSPRITATDPAIRMGLYTARSALPGS